jgi:CcmD family protein
MKRIATLLVLVLILAAPLHARQAAPQTPPQTPPAAAKDEFVPVQSPINPEDAIPAPRLVATAYGFIWVVLFGYLWSVRSRLARVEREIEVVSRRIASGGK